MATVLRILGCLFALALLGAEHGRDYGRHGVYIWNMHVVDGLFWAVTIGFALLIAAVWCFIIAETID